MNSTDGRDFLAVCEKNDNICNLVLWDVLLVTTNCISLILNVFHVSILTRMKALRSTKYLSILQHISIADALCAATFIIKFLCPIRHASFYNRPLSAFISILDFVFYTRYFLLMAASLERVTALWQPLHYEKYFCIRKLNIMLIVQWMVCFCIVVFRDLAYYEHICMSMTFGPSNVNVMPASIISLCVTFFPSCVIAVCLILIAIELRKMKQQYPATDLATVTTATKFVSIISIIFLLCLLPIILSLVSRKLAKVLLIDGNNLVSSAWFAQSVYGILNTITYGLLTKSYREEIRTLFCWRKVTVTPFNSNSFLTVGTIESRL